MVGDCYVAVIPAELLAENVLVDQVVFNKKDVEGGVGWCV